MDGWQKEEGANEKQVVLFTWFSSGIARIRISSQKEKKKERDGEQEEEMAKRERINR